MFFAFLLSGVVLSQELTIEQHGTKTVFVLTTEHIKGETVRFKFSTGLWLTYWNQTEPIALDIKLDRGKYSVQVVDDKKRLIVEKEFEVK